MTCKPERTDGFPLLGDPFPEMRVHTTHGPKNIPGDYKGKWFMLFSHPADFTPVCTTEFVSFAKRFEDFQKLDCELIGLSADQVFSHIKWVEWIKDNLDVEIPFPIIADNGDIAKKLGMIHPGKGTNTVRAVFLVDPEGIVRLILYYPQEIGRNVDEILRRSKLSKCPTSTA
jgi:peroxiredoxin (alkyl hydroperoxide reductase subunit C)